MNANLFFSKNNFFVIIPLNKVIYEVIHVPLEAEYKRLVVESNSLGAIKYGKDGV